MKFYINPKEFYKNIANEKINIIMGIQLSIILFFSIMASNLIRNELASKFTENGIHFNNSFFIGILIFLIIISILLLLLSIQVNSWILKFIGIILGGSPDIGNEFKSMTYINLIPLFKILALSIVMAVTGKIIELNICFNLTIYIVIGIYLFLFFKYNKKLLIFKSILGSLIFIGLYSIVDIVKIFI